MEKLPALDDKNSESVLKNGGRVVLDFWAPSCAPCVGLEKLLTERAPTFRDQLTIYKVNADESIETAMQFGVRGLPTIVFVKDGKHLDTIVGAPNSAKLDAILLRWSRL